MTVDEVLSALAIVLVVIVLVQRWNGWSKWGHLVEVGASFALLGGAVGWGEDGLGTAITYGAAVGVPLTIVYWISIPRRPMSNGHDDPPPEQFLSPHQVRFRLGRRVANIGAAGAVIASLMIAAGDGRIVVAGWLLLLLSAASFLGGFGLAIFAYRKGRLRSE